MKPLLFFIFSVFLAGLTTESALAYPLIYEDDEISIPLPDNLLLTKCTDTLSEKFPSGCRLIIPFSPSVYPVDADHYISFIHPPEDPLGIIFVTISDKFTLHSKDGLQKHLEESESALSGRDSVQVMQSRILNTQPLTGMMDILRKDGVLTVIPALSQPPVRQTSLIFPTKDKLVQVFFYLPIDKTEAVDIYTQLLEFFPQNVSIFSPPIEIPEETSDQEPSGVLSLMPRALILGGTFSILFMILLCVRSRISRKNRERKMQQQDEIIQQLEIDSEE